MNAMKRICSLMIALTMVLSLLPTGVLAAQVGDHYDVSDDNIVSNGEQQDFNKNGETPTEENPKLVEMSKMIDGTEIPNQFEITIQVKTKVEIKKLKYAEDIATVLVIDTSYSMEQCSECGGGLPDATPALPHAADCSMQGADKVTRLSVAKSAAETFLDTYADSATDLPEDDAGKSPRWVSVITFSRGAVVRQGWVDVANGGLATAKAAISGITASSSTNDAGTNIDAGLTLAKNMLRAGGVAGRNYFAEIAGYEDINNTNVVLLSDGAANCYVRNTQTGKEIVYNSTNVSNITYGSINVDAEARAKARADEIKAGGTSGQSYPASKLYTISYADGVRNQEWLANNIASSNTSDAIYSYVAEMGTDLSIPFQQISKTIELSAKPWTVTDPMGDLITFISPESELPPGATLEDEVDGAGNKTGRQILRWDLREVPPRMEGEWFVYEYTYRIELDTEHEDFDENENYPTNDTTSLYYKVEETGKPSIYNNVDFVVPVVKGSQAPALTIEKFAAVYRGDAVPDSDTLDWKPGNGLGTIASGSKVAYKVVITNAGTKLAYITDANFNDMMGTTQFKLDDREVALSTPYTEGKGILVPRRSGGVNGTATLIFDAGVITYGTDGQYKNTATVSKDGEDLTNPDTEKDESDVTFTVEKPLFAVTKQVAEGDTYADITAWFDDIAIPPASSAVFKIVIANSSTVADGSVMLGDVFTFAGRNTAVETLPTPILLNAADDTVVDISNPIFVEAGGAVTLYYVLTSAETAVLGEFINTVTISAVAGTEADFVPGKTRDVATVVIADSMLAVKKETAAYAEGTPYGQYTYVDDDSVRIPMGGKAVYRVTVSNIGTAPGTVFISQLKDTITKPDGSMFQTVDTFYDADGNAYAGDASFGLEPGLSMAFYYTSDVMTTAGVYTNVFVIDDGNPDTEDPGDESEVTVIEEVDLSVTKKVAEYNSSWAEEGKTLATAHHFLTTADKLVLPYGAQAIFEITIINHGNVSGWVSLTDTFTMDSSLTEISNFVYADGTPVEIKDGMIEIAGFAGTQTIYHITEPLSEGKYRNVVQLGEEEGDVEFIVRNPSVYYVNFIAVGPGTVNGKKIVSYGYGGSDKRLSGTDAFPGAPATTPTGDGYFIEEGVWFTGLDGSARFGDITGTVEAVFARYSGYAGTYENGGKVLNLYAFFGEDYEIDTENVLKVIHEYYDANGNLVGTVPDEDVRPEANPRPAIDGKTYDTADWQLLTYKDVPYTYHNGKVVATARKANPNQDRINSLTREIAEWEAEIENLKDKINAEKPAGIDLADLIDWAGDGTPSLGHSMQVGLGHSGDEFIDLDGQLTDNLQKLLEELAQAMDKLAKAEAELAELTGAYIPGDLPPLADILLSTGKTDFTCIDPAYYDYVITLRYNVIVPPVRPTPPPTDNNEDDDDGGTDVPDEYRRRTTTIDDRDPPLAGTVILDNDVPLAALPITGGTGKPALGGFLAFLGGLAVLLWSGKKEDE